MLEKWEVRLYALFPPLRINIGVHDAREHFGWILMDATMFCLNNLGGNSCGLEFSMAPH